MNLPEDLSRRMLAARGVRYPPYEVVGSSSAAMEAAQRLGGARTVVKALVAAGKRGRGGGVVAAASPGEAAAAAGRLLSEGLPAGHGRPAVPVPRVLVQPFVETSRQLYLAATLLGGDRPTALFSLRGGVSVEELAAHDPAAVRRIDFDPFTGLGERQVGILLEPEELPEGVLEEVGSVARALARTVLEEDAVLAEVNPLGVTPSGEVIGLDAKVVRDGNAAFRHPESRRELAEAIGDPLERMAAERGISYVRLEGDIGCLVNGAGLAMELLDMLADAGGSPADFLDVGGGADREGLAAALDILAADARLEVVLVNIFGGILRCDLVAEALVESFGGRLPPWPLVVRLRGHGEAAAAGVLSRSGLPVRLEPDLCAAVRGAVAAASRRREG